jgi:site-specific DNA-methyltransferase (adenine-specific)
VDDIQVEWLNVAQVTPFARNSRTHSDEQVAQVAASIKEFGWTNPILIDESGTIIAGHGRLMAAQRLGADRVPTITLGHLTDAQKRAYVIADNKLALNAGWDQELLAIEVEELLGEGFNLDLTGFGEDEINSLLAEANKVEDGLTDADDAPELPTIPVTATGDVWVLGRHRVICGDATVQTDVEKLMNGQLADMFLTDPPYNVDYTGKTKDALKIQNDVMSDTGFRQFLCDSFATADTVMKQGAVFYIWHADSEGYNFRGACFDVDWEVRQCLIWDKDVMVMGRQDYHWKHEPCLYGWKKGAAHLWASDRKQTTILRFDRPKRNDVHPTMKPVDLIEYQILNNTKGADIVLDVFGGSGSTLIAAEKSGRNAYLAELDEKYVDVIVKRWQDFTGQDAVHEESGQTFNGISKQKDS